MPKKSRAQEAALGRNLEPLYTALVPACCLHLAQSHGWEQIEITVDSNAGIVRDMYAARKVVYTREVVTKCQQELYSHKNPIPKNVVGDELEADTASVNAQVERPHDRRLMGAKSSGISAKMIVLDGPKTFPIWNIRILGKLRREKVPDNLKGKPTATQVPLPVIAHSRSLRRPSHALPRRLGRRGGVEWASVAVRVSVAFASAGLLLLMLAVADGDGGDAREPSAGIILCCICGNMDRIYREIWILDAVHGD
ncbi:hypothetical protein B0H13DRAFT_1857381 [Mycena leptocephala]|nr:hypothetical protein B0H13DRAFT_1857381 [Mycena leptocephala]